MSVAMLFSLIAMIIRESLQSLSLCMQGFRRMKHCNAAVAKRNPPCLHVMQGGQRDFGLHKYADAYARNGFAVLLPGDCLPYKDIRAPCLSRLLPLLLDPLIIYDHAWQMCERFPKRHSSNMVEGMHIALVLGILFCLIHVWNDSAAFKFFLCLHVWGTFSRSLHANASGGYRSVSPTAFALGFGGSDGEPRQLVSPQMQLEDWEAAIMYTQEGQSYGCAVQSHDGHISPAYQWREGLIQVVDNEVKRLF
eukprot:488957-Pelagomonas_calceolata.AAC.2